MTKPNWMYKVRKSFKCRPYLEHNGQGERSGGVHWWISVSSRRKVQSAIQYGLIVFLVFILFLWLGSEAQAERSSSELDTVYLYQSTQVCGITFPDTLLMKLSSSSSSDHKNDTIMTTISTTTSTTASNTTTTTTSATTSTSTTHSNNNNMIIDPIVMETFDSPEMARNNQENNVSIVAHCGSCGACSNPHDISIYDKTKETLFKDSFRCSKRSIIGGRRVTRRCLKEVIGFSDDCNDCWVDNIMCDLKFCLFVCMWHAIFSEVNAETEGQKQALNPCTECDEKRCGPAFVTCAGANRRRSGILSEFERDMDQEVCTALDQGWWNNQHVQDYWALQRTQEEEEEAEKQQQQDSQEALDEVDEENGSVTGVNSPIDPTTKEDNDDDPIRRLRVPTVNG